MSAEVVQEVIEEFKKKGEILNPYFKNMSLFAQEKGYGIEIRVGLEMPDGNYLYYGVDMGRHEIINHGKERVVRNMNLIMRKLIAKILQDKEGGEDE